MASLAIKLPRVSIEGQNEVDGRNEKVFLLKIYKAAAYLRASRDHSSSVH